MAAAHAAPDLEEAHDYRNIEDAVRGYTADIVDKIDLQGTDGVIRWSVAPPAKVLLKFMEERPHVRTRVLLSLQRHGPLWRAAAYLDEATPGNALALQNRRKVYCFYFSFVEVHWAWWFPRKA